MQEKGWDSHSLWALSLGEHLSTEGLNEVVLETL